MFFQGHGTKVNSTPLSLPHLLRQSIGQQEWSLAVLVEFKIRTTPLAETWITGTSPVMTTNAIFVQIVQLEIP
jgi:hypothetical protein